MSSPRGIRLHAVALAPSIPSMPFRAAPSASTTGPSDADAGPDVPLATDELTAESLEPFRRELTGYCYRMLGSGFEAEDAVQETMVRAWRSLDSFEGRSSLRSWMYRIATNVCLDLLRGRQRRAQPMEMGPAGSADGPGPGNPLPEHAWVQPVRDDQVMPTGGDPAEVAATRETIRLAFVTALQHLPPRQRAVLILREVLRWRASEVAELLDTSVPSVNSSLQRARATLAAGPGEAAAQGEVDAEQQELLARYCDAFERYDVEALVALLHEDATFTMPPHPLWLIGPDQVARWLTGHGIVCKGSRLVAVQANGNMGFATYHDAGGGRYEPFAIQVLETSGDRISTIHNFLGGDLFGYFGLPAILED